MPVKTITVQVREDHLENLARTKPMNALAELIWNALDAEATEVRIEFIENEMEGIQSIRVIDNGNGLSYMDAVAAFQNLGGSWKRDEGRSQIRHRTLHGKYGKGRFRAFSLGGWVEWRSVYRENEQAHTFSILGKAESLGEFTISEPKEHDSSTGMLVEITNPYGNVGLLRGVKAQQEVTDIFALYLKQYPDTRIVYDKVPLDPAHAESRYYNYELGEMVMQNGERVSATLTVVEWNLPGKRGVLFCDANGFMLHNPMPRLHFRGFSYTAYLRSAYIALLEREGLLQAEELCPDVRQLMDAARSKLREHFTLREAERAQDTLAEWRDMGIYPYEGAAKNDSEANERRIFDIYATHLNQICPDFTTSTPRNKRLVLRMVRELVHIEPTRVARILDELLEFPEDKEDAVLELMRV